MYHVSGIPETWKWFCCLHETPLRFEKITGTRFHRLVMPNKKKYAAYYHALKQHTRLEQKWRNENSEIFTVS